MSGNVQNNRLQKQQETCWKCLSVRNSFNIFSLSEMSLRGNIHVALKHFLRRNRMKPLPEQVTEISDGKPELDNIKLATRCRVFFTWRMTKHEKKPWRMWWMWYIFQTSTSPDQSGRSSSDVKLIWAHLGTAMPLKPDRMRMWLCLTLQCNHTSISGCVFRHF